LKEDLAEAKLTALLNESGSSESEYMPVDRPESEEDAEGEGGGEEERPAKLVVVKKDVKKKNKGLLTREQIMAAAAAMSDSGLDDLSSIRTSTYVFPIHQSCVPKIFNRFIQSIQSGFWGGNKPDTRVRISDLGYPKFY
jgi:hypothetical protein